MAATLLAAPVVGSPRFDEVDDLRCSVAPLGDVDGDGAADFALARRGIGPRGFGGPATPPDRGVVWIFSGRDGKRLRTLEAPEDCMDFGRALENVGDVDCDGVPELAVAGGGRVWLFTGKNGSVLHELAGDLAGPGFGHSLAGGLDADGDGCADVMVYRANDLRHRSPISGTVLLYSGRTGELRHMFGCHAKPSFADSVTEERYTRVDGDELLPAISLVPDRDGDGRAEVRFVRERRLVDACGWIGG